MLTQRIFDSADRTPDKPALIRDGEVWSYARFADAIARARGYFIRNNVGGSGLVTIAVDDQALAFILGLALRSLGLTTMNRGFDLDDAPLLRWAVTSASEVIPNLAELCIVGRVPLLRVSLEGEKPVGLDEVPPPERLGGNIVHTSGTTGIPKKVLREPSFEDAFLRRRRDTYGMTEHSVVTAFNCPIWTGSGYNQPARAWAAGGTAIIQRTEPLYRPLLDPRLTHAVLTPLILRRLLAYPETAFPRSETLRVYVGAGTISEAEVEAIKARISPIVYNILASTEGGALGITLMESSDDRRWHQPVAGREVQIIDDFDRPVRVGVVGRVRVTMEEGLNGYLNDEAATATFFRDGFFYPGDLGVFREDGRFALQGRFTEILNIDGAKVAPAPIEDRLRKALDVVDVVLFSMLDQEGVEQLHMALESAKPLANDRLAAALFAELPNLGRGQVHVLATFPRNAMGKVIRPALMAEVAAGRTGSVAALGAAG